MGDDLNIDYYLESPTLLIAYIAEPNAQLTPLLSSWPQWEGKLREGTAAAAGLCHTTELEQGVVPCEVQVWWGEPSDYLDGAALQMLAGVMGGATLLPQSESGSMQWLRATVQRQQRYLGHFVGGRPSGPNVCFHIQRAR